METTYTRNATRPDWYLEESHIRQHQNARWSADDRKLIYKLNKIQNQPTDNIRQVVAQRLGVSLTSDLVTKTRINNQIRISKSVAAGRCIRCTRKLSPEDLIANENRGDQKVCVHCLQSDSHYKRTLRNKAIKKGICGMCHRRKALPGHTQCMKCLNYVQRTRILKGLCGSCGKHPINKSRSKALCNNCLEANKVRGKKYRKEERNLTCTH